jgi:hypothetical protein
MSRDSIRYIAAIGLLAVALIGAGVFVWLPEMRQSQTAASRAFVTDIDNWRQTDQQRLVESHYDFALGPNLAEFPLQVGQWDGVDIPQTNLEVFILLEPEEYVYRRYQNPEGQILWLSMIGSRKSKSFHPPQICYSTDGWRTQVSSAAIGLDDGEVYALQVDADKEGQRHLVLYFYLWPDSIRDTANGLVLFKMTLPIVGETTTVEDAFDLAQDFAREVFLRGEKL